MQKKDRRKMDRRLERAGLLNYQTKGLSSGEIASRYGKAGIGVQDKWFGEQYGNRPAQPQPQQMQPTNFLPPTPGGNGAGTIKRMYGSGESGVALQRPLSENQNAISTSNIQTGWGNFAGQINTPMDPMRKSILQYSMNNGLLVKESVKQPEKPMNMTGLATVQDAVNGQANWSDVGVEQRQQVLSDPNFYKTNQITKYPKWMQQQILADPSFDWKQLPKWQQKYFDLSSSPAGMGAAQGALMGLGGGGVGSLIGAGLGAGLGWGAAKSGYDATKEAWQQKNLLSKGFGWMNFLAEQMEKAVGLGVQTAGALADKNTDVGDVLSGVEINKKFNPFIFSKNFDANLLTGETWNAGATTFESLTPAIQSAVKWDGKLDWNDAMRLVPSAYWADRLWNVVTNPEKFKGEEIYLGANVPEELSQSWNERMTEARQRIQGGENYREVMMDFQTGIMGQMGDMVGQAFADPLNVMPKVETRVLGKIADVTGNKVAAEAFKNSNAPIEAAQRYKNLVQTGEALKINPEFKVDQMGMISRFAAGVTKDGQIKTGIFGKGLLDPITGREFSASNPVELVVKAIKDPRGFIDNMTSLTPQSRAQIGAGMFYENIGALLTRFEDPHEAGKYLKALSNSDMETWKELGSRFADSPEFYTVLPALKDFNGSALDGITQAWDLSQPNRDMLTRVSDVLGEQPGKLLDDLAARGTAEQDFQRISQRLQESTDPQAKALLGEIEGGRFTADTLKQIVDIYTGDGALAWHPNQVKAQMLDALGSHFDEWVSKRMMLDQTPEAKSAFFRTAGLMKQAQSILLLGMSPGYAIQNGLSNMVHRAATGIYGYMTPKQINGWMDQFGMTPARFEEGVGIGGMVEQAAGSSKVHTEAQSKAVKGKGALTDAKQKLGKLSSAMPFSKLSSWFEKTESKQAFAIGMKQFWNQSWRRGVGFKAMSPELVGAIKSMGIQPERIYAAIEAGLNQTAIEKTLYGRFEGVQSRSLIDEAAKKTGLSSQQAADMLDKVGVLDTLDTFLKGQTTRDGVTAAFRRAERVAQDYLDMQTGEDLKARAEHVKQKLAVEQPSAAFEVIQNANTAFTDTWMDHYFRFGDVMNDLTLLDDPAMKSKAIEQAYQVSDAEFRRTYARNAANYTGIFDAWGKSGHPDALGALQAMGEIDTSMKAAYDFMRQSRREFFDKYRNDFDNPQRWDDWEASQKGIDRGFSKAFKDKHIAEVKAGKHLADIFESLYGKAAGEAARSWWEDVVKFNDEIVAKEKTARSEFEGMAKDQREAAKQKYYAETKILAIAEAQKINEAGIARLERVVKRGDGGGVKTPTEPTPQGPVNSDQLAVTPPADPSTARVRSAQDEGGKVKPADEINALMAQAEQRAANDARVQAEHVASVWDVAEEYGRQSLPYDRTILQDRFALIWALRKTEYGGMADLTGLNDPRLTPELVREVMERRQTAKMAEVQQVVGQAMVKAEEAGSNARIPKINENTTILRAISEHGGISLELAKDLTGEKRPKTAPGVFTKKGFGIDEMARMLADDGYPIDLTDVNDPGGIQQTTALMERARRGDKVYPMAHDHDAMIARAQDAAAAKAFGEAFDFAAVEEVPFDAALWQVDFERAVQTADLTAVYEKIGELPEDVSNQLSVNGRETWADYVSRVSDEVVALVEVEARDVSIAEAKTRADDAMFAGEVRAEYAETRNMMKEKFAEAFDLTDEQATAYMELSDALSGWYENKTGENGEAFYSRYYDDVKKDQLSDVGDERLEQDNVNRRMTAQEVEGYARALVREGSAELRRAVRNENVKADRIALLDAAYRLNPEMAKGVAKQTTDVLFQEGKFVDASNAKGAVTFDETGIKATIHAFESKDFSTLVHENAHVFRRVLSDVAARTGDVEIRADLDTIESWAGVKDGTWDRTAEEKFARGFEEYLAEGKAPTPKLARAFESFKNWMLEIYRTITGSAIDVKLTDEVRGVFDRMLGEEGQKGRGVEVPEGQRRSEVLKSVKEKGYATAEEAIYLRELGLLRDIENPLPPKARDRMKKLAEESHAAYVQENLARVKSGQPTQADALFQRAEPVDTPEFKRWFGESKVVDESGKPKVLYHGTKEDFQIFEKSKRKSYDDLGFFFTDDKDLSKYYGGKVMDVYVSLKRPLEIKSQREWSKLVNQKDFTELHSNYDGVIGKWNTELGNPLEVYIVFEPEQIKSVNNRGTFDPNDPNILFQDNVQPVGALDSASQFLPHSQVMDEGWSKFVKPLLSSMEEGAVKQLGERPISEALGTSTVGASSAGVPSAQRELRQYMNGVKNDMATSKLAAMRWGEQRRDFAMLNYNKRYGFDRWMDVVYPYQFFYSRSMMTWAGRALDKPAWFANVARMRNQQNRYERDIPERLRNKIKINAPWMPDWMGDSLYIDPLSNLFTPLGFLRPFERMQADSTQQELEAERIMQEWASEGAMSDERVQMAAQSRSGSDWERALAEAKIRRESEIANPADFFSTMFGPAWYLSAPLNAMGIGVPGISKGDKNKVNPTPLLNTSRALDAVSQGTWAEPFGDLIGLLGKPEEWARKKAGLPTLGEYGDYYIKRQLTNMTAEGLIDSEQAQTAMIEKQGELWEQATERVKLELAMRVPTMGAIYAGLHGENLGEGLKGLTQAALPTLFGSGLLPEGELEYRGLKQEWNETWAKYDRGDKEAVTEFFEEHPEYEAYLAKGKSDDELMQSFLVGKVWDGYSALKGQVWEKYMALGKTNQKQVNAELGDLWRDSFMNKETRDYAAIPLETLIEWDRVLSGGGEVPAIESGDLFGQAFLNKETRSYESIGTDTLIEWARALDQRVPKMQSGAPLTASTAPMEMEQVPGVNLYDPSVTRITDEFFGQRTEKFPDYYEVQAGYYALPKSERVGYLRRNPSLKKYWDWKDSWYDSYPDLVPVMNGQVFKRVDTSLWPPTLEEYVAGYAYSGEKIPNGARKALEQQWIMAGRPNDDLDTWINSVVVPSMLYGGE